MLAGWITGRATALLAIVGIGLLIALIIVNATSDWVSTNGGLASWLQALGSLFAIVAVSLPVLLERRLAIARARQSVLSSARMACELMSVVAHRAFDPDAHFSDWWVPQWHIVDEVMASCPIHEIDSADALEAFVAIRELYGRMRGWDEKNDEPWPRDGSGGIQSFIGNLCLNGSMQLQALEAAFEVKAAGSSALKTVLP